MLLLAAIAFAAQPSKRPADHIVGKEIYDRSCWQCHGADLSGDGPAAGALGTPVPDLRGTLDYEDVDPHLEVILYGQGDMPAFGTELDRPTARRVMVYLKRLEDGKEEPTEHAEPKDEVEDAPDEQVEDAEDGPEVKEPEKRLPI